MEGNIGIPQLIQMSLSGDQYQINQATSQLMQITSNPESIQAFLELFERETNATIKNYYLIYANKIIESHWNSYYEQMQTFIIQKLLSYTNLNINDMKITSSLSNIFSTLFTLCPEGNILDIVFSSQNNDFVFFWFARCTNDFSSEFITNNIARLTQLAHWGLTKPIISHLSGSAKIFILLLKYTNDPEIFAPACQFVISSLPNEENFGNDDTKNTYWALVADLFEKRIIGIELFSQFLPVLSKSTVALDAIEWFSDIVPILSKEQLIGLLQANVEILTNRIIIDNTLPECLFEIFYNAITEADERDLVFEIIKSLSAGDEPHQCIGIYLLIPLISATPISSSDEADFVSGCLQNALKSESPIFQEAAFRVINDFEDASPELLSSYSNLIELTVPYLSSPNQIICSLAYSALISLLEESDSEFEHLLPFVWEKLGKGEVNNDMMTSFIEVISLLIQHAENEHLDDAIVDSILEWLETIYNPDSPSEIIIRSSALSIISSLITNEESLCDSLIPFCQQTVEESFASNDRDSILNVFTYLNAIATSFKQRSKDLISPFVDKIFTALQVGDYKVNAAVSSSYYIGYSGDVSCPLMAPLIPIIFEFLRTDDSQLQDSGCSCLKPLARVLAGNPVSLEFYQCVITILTQEKEQELLRSAFDAAKSLYKRCHSVDAQQFSSMTMEFLSNFMQGKIAFLDGTLPFQSMKLDYLIQDVMNFIGSFFHSNPENVTPICNSLIQWMLNTKESNVFPFIGTLCDAVEFSNVDVSIPIQICEFINNNAASFKDPDLQQNVSYFLALLCRRFPQQVGLVKQNMPCVINWWSRALSKKNGFQEVLANIASLFLSYALLDPEFPQEFIIGALQKFPPAELLETETMCCSIIQLYTKNQNWIPQILAEMALALSRLFIESQSHLETRKIPMEVYQKSIEIFKLLMQNPQIKQHVLSCYDNRKTKKNHLIKLISQ